MFGAYYEKMDFTHKNLATVLKAVKQVVVSG